MIIEKSPEGQYLLYKTEDAKEYMKLMKFPGLEHKPGLFFSRHRLNLSYNLLQRLRQAKFKIKLSQELLTEIETPLVLKKIPEDFKYFTIPLVFQEIALRYLYTCEGGGLLLEPGMGKTKVILDFIALMKFKKSCIVCPKPLRFVWEDERQRHRPDKTMYVIETTDEKIEWEAAQIADIVVINYNKAVALKKLLMTLGFDFICADEALIKDPTTERTKSLTEVRVAIPHRALMSGTLVNNTPFDVFSPVRFLEPCLVGESFYKFTDEYAVKITQKLDNNAAIKRIVGVRREEEIRDILRSVSIVMTKAEWLKLPPKHFHTRIVQISDMQKKVYGELSRNYITMMAQGTVEVDNALAMMAKLTQISNGFMYIKGEQELNSLDPLAKEKKKSKAKRETFFFDEQPKIDGMLSLLNNELKGRRLMIWYNMDAERILIEKALTEYGISYLCISGGDKGIGEKVRRFNSSLDVRILCAQAKTLNYGVTVLGRGSRGQADEDDDGEYVPGISEVYTQLFYSLNFSLEIFLQQQDRIHRIGQTYDCDYWFLLANTPTETRTKKALDDKMDIRGRMLIDIIGSLENLV